MWSMVAAVWSTVGTVISRATLVDWLLLVGSLLALLYYVGTYKYDFFERERGIPGLKPRVPFLGTFWPLYFGSKPLMDLIKEVYDRGEGHRVVGIFELRSPLFLVRDPEMIKDLTVKKFDCFINHRKPMTDVGDRVLTKNLVALRDQRWRDMRATLSPAFTSSKLKGMFDLISACGKQLADHIRQEHGKAGTEKVEMDVKDLFTRVANDIIATTAFGISVDSLKNPDNDFYRMGKETTTPNLKQIVIFFGYMLFPKLMKLLRVPWVSTRAVAFFDALVHETLRERQERNIVRPDMLHLLMQARQGTLRDDAHGDAHTDAHGDTPESQQPKAHGKLELDDDDVTAQAIIFFFAGFETYSTALCFCTYALATHPHVQRKLQEEIDSIMEATGGSPSYEHVQGMKYLDMVISEALRLYPPGVVMDRECSAPCVFEATSIDGIDQPAVRFQADDKIWVPVHGLHRDPRYWSRPDVFDPERFSDENKHNIKPFTYMPFGLGPRNCIGQRFALLEMKLVIIYMMANFEISRLDGNDGTIQYAKGMFIQPKSGHKTFFKPRVQVK